MSTIHCELIPNGWSVRFKYCPAGLFVYNGTVGIITEYGTDKQEAFLESGCVASIDGNTIVQPVSVKWTEEEEYENEL